jgi:acyl dehydratase
MKIGIRYCGGCNSRYDRAKEVKKLMQQFPEQQFCYEMQNPGICDVWLVVCGCLTACAATDDLMATKKLFLLRLPKDFAGVWDFLRREDDEATDPQQKILHIGDSASLSKRFSADDISTFAKLTGDYGKLHTDSVFAAKYGFGRPVIHGVLTASLMSSIMGTNLPGNGTILVDEKLHFHDPVFVGDTITATVTLTEFTDHKRFYIGKFSGTCHNQTNVLVVTGTYEQMMMKNLFTIV